MVAASMLAAGCSDVVSLVAARPRSELAVLQQQSSAPAPAGTQFYVANNRTTTRNISHPDPGITLFARATFPPGCLATIGGQAASATDSVQVSVQPIAGSYNVNIGAANVTFSTSTPPSLSFFFATYGDVSGSRAGSRYSTNTAYAQALMLWREESLDRFSSVSGSGPSGLDAVQGAIAAPGNYLVAALK